MGADRTDALKVWKFSEKCQTHKWIIRIRRRNFFLCSFSLLAKSGDSQKEEEENEKNAHY